jgi:RimJ/RimL family protein N-acetyltransferase
VITLRPHEPADVDIFYEHQADPVASDMAKFPSRDLEAHRKHWETRVFGDPQVIGRTVLVDGVVAGNLGSWRDSEGRRLVGYWIGREFWGRGVASEALRLFVNEITERPLYAYVAVTNLGSARVLEKAGFVGDAEAEVGGGNIEERLYILS